MPKPELIVVLGSQPDTATWELPEQLYRCLDKAISLHKKTGSSIAVCGKWSIAVEAKGFVQPFMECDKMAEYLMRSGVSQKAIFKENKSMDTISNLYYLKVDYLIPHDVTSLMFVAAEFRLPRLRFLVSKVLGDDYAVSFVGAGAAADTALSSYDEPHSLKIQTEFLRPMKDGDHEWLADKFYTAPVYRYWYEYDKTH